MGWLTARVCVHILVAMQPIMAQTQFNWSPSELTKLSGHYPHTLCTLTNVVLNASDGIFYYSANTALHSACGCTGDVWQLKNEPHQSQTEIQCDEEYDVGHIFLIFYFAGGSNYYHLHYDMMLPLYQDAYFGKSNSSGPSRVFMPAVETTRLQRIDWMTPAFQNPDKYFVQMTKFMAGQYPFRPLDGTLRRKGRNICLKQAKFGTAHVSFSDETFIRSFVQHVRTSLHIPEPHHIPPRVGVIHRSGRRQILNDKELVDMLSKEVDAELLEFVEMSYKEQVQAMQRFTVLAGINGAGLMNCLYLPANSVCIQMGAYKSDMNYEQFGAVLKSRGPYREWHNTHEDLHRPVRGDAHNIRPNTIVHLDEFHTLIQEALMVASASSKDEL